MAEGCSTETICFWSCCAWFCPCSARRAAGMVNAISSGKLSLQIVHFLRGYTETDAGAAQLFIILSLVSSILIWIFLRNVYSAIPAAGLSGSPHL